MTTAALMLQGTGSDVGKSLIVAGLCRAYSRRGLTVRPFKPQNMSNNAAVTADGGEIGRAQALQARACGTDARTDMNPVLLKPQTDTGSQVIVQGEVWRNARANEYYRLKPTLLPRVLESFERLAQGTDLMLVEGAGSAAEVNLRAGDIANMGFAEAAGVPVALVADIDRGGVIASLVGTCELLSPTERGLLTGYVINRFRGDVTLFDTGIDIIAARTGLSCYGVLPYFAGAAALPAEDSVSIGVNAVEKASALVKVAVPVLSRISNFDDLDPLLAEPDVEVRFIQPGSALPGDADLVVLPGSKATIADLRFLKHQGWDIDVTAHLRRGGWLIGLCGGYQMLGEQVRDPTGIEGEATTETGLSLLAVDTELRAAKHLTRVEGQFLATSDRVYGYEMHVGVTTGRATESPMLRLAGRNDGAVSADGKVMGCYLHGLFAADVFRHALLARIREGAGAGVAYERLIERTLDDLAAYLELHIDLDAMLASARDFRRVSSIPAARTPAVHRQ